MSYNSGYNHTTAAIIHAPHRCSGRYGIYTSECHEEGSGKISAVGDVKTDIKHAISLLVFHVALLKRETGRHWEMQ
jgi:hypothetical protein